MSFLHRTSVLLIGLSGGAIFGAGQKGEALRVFVQARVDQGTVSLAEPEASHIFEQAGVRLIWQNCGSDDPCETVSDSRSPVLLILKETGKRGLGYSLISNAGGIKAILGLENIERLSASSRISKSQILGAAIAHELGHLLIGPAHTEIGLMHGHWDVHDLCRLEQRQLKFDPDQCTRIRAAAIARSPFGHVLLAKRMP